MMYIKKDDESIFKDKSLIRRRFYLSQQSLNYIDEIAVREDKSPSIVLDDLLKSLKEGAK